MGVEEIDVKKKTHLTVTFAVEDQTRAMQLATMLDALTSTISSEARKKAEVDLNWFLHYNAGVVATSTKNI